MTNRLIALNAAICYSSVENIENWIKNKNRLRFGRAVTTKLKLNAHFQFMRVIHNHNGQTNATQAIIQTRFRYFESSFHLPESYCFPSLAQEF